MSARPSTPQQRLQLKAATRRAVKLAGGQDSAASIGPVSSPTVAKYGLPHYEHHYLRLDFLLDLELDIQDPLITRQLATIQNFALVPIAGCSRHPTVADIITFTRGFCDMQTELMAALDDGEICPREAAELLALMDRNESHRIELRKKLQHIAGGGSEGVARWLSR